MSVDFFWRRTDPALLDGVDDARLCELVPGWFDDRYTRERQEGITLGVEDTGALIDEMLRLGAGSGPDAAAASLPVDAGGGLRDEYMVGLLTPEQVTAAAAFLAGVRPAAWVQQHHAQLAQAARRMGYQTPFDDRWARQVAEDADDLVDLFRQAAESGEAIIIKVIA